MKHLLISDSHERKRLAPFIKFGKTQKKSANELSKEERAEFYQNAEAVRKRLSSAIVFGNLLVNAGFARESTGLKLIGTMAFREWSLANEGISALNSMGATHSNNNYVELFSEKAEVQKMNENEWNQIKKHC